MRRIEGRAGLLPVETLSAVERGRELRARRLTLGIKSVHELVRKIQESGQTVDRGTVTRAERGTASEDTYDRLEAWFTRFEEETGEDDYEPPPSQQIEVEFRDVFGIGQVIYRGSPDDFPEFEAALEKLIQRERQQRRGQ